MLINRYKLCFYTFFAIFWIACCWGFVASELIPSLQRLNTIRALLVDVVLILLGACCLQTRRDLTVMITFLALSLFSSIFLNHESWGIYLNGFRDFVGILFVVPVLRYFLTSSHAREFRQSFDKALTVWLVLQAVCITWQFIRYGASDMGGGSMGEGASGMTSMMIYIVSFYLIAPRWDSANYIQSLLKNKFYILLLYPSFLNETKISFLLFILYFMLLVKFDRKLVLKLLYIIPLGIIILAGIFSVYISATGQDSEKFFTTEMYEEYLYGLDVDEIVDIGQKVQDGLIEVDPTEVWQMDVPRFAKIALIIPILTNENGGLLLGTGIGQFKGWVTGRLTPFAKEYEWILIGSRPTVFVMLVQLGLAGIGWLVWFLWQITFSGKTSRPLGRQLRVLLAFSFLMIMIYNDSLREPVVCAVMFGVLLAVRYFPAPEPKPE